ncbi:serine/threonine-protein kinase RsbW [Devosia crocina]|uniref:Serine/threonine-protein kinase RsbW n=1 Tax=Devosia crocina TaxID=429728 RepID=A0A1I7MZT2_9HYPH|nr:ATP-binding protein [Devosia crocina]SFV27913.1 serine/threonine-protein kinase RsbW [Devosia crocina]
MSPNLSLKIDSDLGSVELVAKAVRALCSDSLGEDALNDVEIGVVEAINNVIKHGYAGQKGSAVEVSVGLRQDRVVIDIVDQAPPMPPDALGAPLYGHAGPSSTEDLPEGGMGLSLIQMTMDEVSYSSEQGSNRLRLTKLIGSE